MTPAELADIEWHDSGLEAIHWDTHRRQLRLTIDLAEPMDSTLDDFSIIGELVFTGVRHIESDPVLLEFRVAHPMSGQILDLHWHDQDAGTSENAVTIHVALYDFRDHTSGFGTIALAYDHVEWTVPPAT